MRGEADLEATQLGMHPADLMQVTRGDLESQDPLRIRRSPCDEPRLAVEADSCLELDLGATQRFAARLSHEAQFDRCGTWPLHLHGWVCGVEVQGVRQVLAGDDEVLCAPMAGVHLPSAVDVRSRRAYRVGWTPEVDVAVGDHQIGFATPKHVHDAPAYGRALVEDQIDGTDCGEPAPHVHELLGSDVPRLRRNEPVRTRGGGIERVGAIGARRRRDEVVCD